MYSARNRINEEVFYPGKKNKWIRFKTRMWRDLVNSGSWDNNELWFYAHFEQELRDREDPIPSRLNDLYEPEPSRAILVPI